MFSAEECKYSTRYKFSTFSLLIFSYLFSLYSLVIFLSFCFLFSLFPSCYLFPWVIYSFYTWNWVGLLTFLISFWFLEPHVVCLYWLFFLSFLGYNHGRVIWFFWWIYGYNLVPRDNPQLFPLLVWVLFPTNAISK